MYVHGYAISGTLVYKYYDAMLIHNKNIILFPPVCVCASMHVNRYSVCLCMYMHMYDVELIFIDMLYFVYSTGSQRFGAEVA